MLNGDGNIQSKSLPSPHALKNELHASSRQLAFVQEARHQIAQILQGFDRRLLLIVGPCSIHDMASAKEYASKLKSLSDQVSHAFFIVMRTYFEKPRTALGWKGLIYDPHLNGSNDISTGLYQARELLLHLADLQIATGTEFLDPIASHFVEDLISWACIGARTAESQIHRQFASGLPMPVAFKNSTSGNIDVAVNGILSASSPHSFLSIDDSGKIVIKNTKGNSSAHLALRGGETGPNCDENSIAYAVNRLRRAHIAPQIVVDCSHDNSYRKHEEQPAVFESVVRQYLKGNSVIRGLALESHLFAGNQRLISDRSKLHYAVSLTDPCLDWNATEQLICWGADMLGSHQDLLGASLALPS